MKLKQINELRERLNDATDIIALGDPVDAVVRYDVYEELIELTSNDKSIFLSIEEAKNLRKFLNKLLG